MNELLEKQSREKTDFCAEGAETETPKKVENGEGVSPSPADCGVWETALAPQQSPSRKRIWSISDLKSDICCHRGTMLIIFLIIHLPNFVQFKQ